MEKETLYRFFGGTASYEEEEEVCDWVEASKENEAECMKERKIFDLLLIQNKKNIRQLTQKGKMFSLGNLLKYAVAVAIFITCGIQIYTFTQSDIDPKINTITVPAGQRVNITLSDGTNVWLNAGTKMTYPPFFAEGKREITLDGEGYFEVSKDVDRPFIVKTNKYDIEVLGTKFNVDAYQDCFSAALMEGSVQITGNTASSEKIILKPEQKADLKEGKLLVDKIQNYEVYRWKEGLLSFEHIAFNALMKEFEKTYDIQIVIENKQLDNYICSGKFRISDGVDYILHVLQRDVQFQFQRNENNRIIYIK